MPSAPAFSRSRSPASWPRRWTRTRPPRSPRVYVPNEYTVYLSPEDHERFQGYERSLEQELSGHLLEHARRHDYDLLTRPVVEFGPDERLRLGEFGIQTRLVKPPPREGAEPSQGEQGHTMVYSAVQASRTSARKRAPAGAPGRRPGRSSPSTTAATCSTARRRPSAARRSRVRARRTPTSPGATPSCGATSTGDWQIVDLGSTNGIKVNGRRVASSRSAPGDQVTLGTTTFSFDIEQ